MESRAATVPPVVRVILYVKDIPKVAAFYQRFFEMHALPGATDGWLELGGSSSGCTIALHKASVAQKSGAAMKLVFGVTDIHGFKNAKERAGLKFGAVHEVDGIEFANAKDPAGNSIQISNRGLKGRL
jgi:predicted enzyme related to lactoylglutathione lyase